MLHLHRLVFCALIFFSAWLPTTSHAGTTVPPSASQWYLTQGGFGTDLAASALNNCRLTYSSTGTVSNLVQDTATHANFTCNYPPSSAAMGINGTSSTCPSNSVLSAGVCQCSTGYIGVGYACVFNGCPPNGTSAGTWTNLSKLGTLYLCDTTKASGNTSSPYCVARVNSDFGSRATLTSPMIYQGSGVYTNDLCNGTGTGDGSTVVASTPTGTSTISIQTTPCPKGQPGTVNGVVVCVPFPAGTGIATPVSSTVTSSDPTNGTKTTSLTGSTTCESGICISSTTTSTTVNGSTTIATGSSSQALTDYCTTHPKDVVCGGSDPSAFGGSCAAGFTCAGDAIQCSIAREIYTRNCALFNPDTDSNSTYNKALSGVDGQNTDAMKTAAHSAQVSVGSFDQAGKGWSRSCPADPVIPISWGTVSTWTLPLSRVCSPLQILANAAVGLTLLASLVWVIGGRTT